METGKKTEKREFWKPVPQTFSVLKAGSKILKPYGVMDPYAAYKYIRDGVSREQTEKLRKPPVGLSAPPACADYAEAPDRAAA